jgi:hypothetical protein
LAASEKKLVLSSGLLKKPILSSGLLKKTSYIFRTFEEN